MKTARFALLCTLADGVEETRVRVRAEHLAYVQAHAEEIVLGGPLLGDDGRPEMMLILLASETREAAEAFAASEPYGRHGVFSEVRLRPWSQVIPAPTAPSP